MERKEVKFDRVDVDAAGTLEGYASIFDVVDFQNDVVLPGAFAGSLERFLERGFIGWHHDMAVPVAYPIAASEDARGLFIAARFHTTAEGQRARTIAGERVTAGKNMGLSIGYTVKSGGARRRDDGVRELRELELLEVSLVMLPANELAGVTAVKSHAPIWSETERDALRQRSRIRLERSKSDLLRVEHRRLQDGIADLEDADFYEIVATHVPSETRRMVAATLEKASAELGIALPRVRYFRRARPDELEEDRALARRLVLGDLPLFETFRDVKGLSGKATAWNGEVWIRADLEGDQLAYVVAHEARHIAQGIRSDVSQKARDADQLDAHTYGERFLERFGGSKSKNGDPTTPSPVAAASLSERIDFSVRMSGLSARDNFWRFGMRTSDSYENKATTTAEDAAVEKNDARDALASAEVAFDAAIERRDQVIAELLPTFGRNLADHPRFTDARATVQAASDTLQEAMIRYNRVAKTHERRAIDLAAQEERARVEEKLALQRVPTRPRGVGARIREFLS